MSTDKIQRHKRVQTDLPLQWSAHFDSRILNISRGGLYFRGNAPLRVGQEIELSFPLPGHHAGVRVRGAVRWTAAISPVVADLTPFGIGIEFIGVDAATAAALESYIAEKLQQPRTLNRVRVRIVVDYFFAGESYRTLANDLSPTGMFLVTDEPLALEDIVHLKFHLPESNASIKTSAMVRWRHDTIPQQLSDIITPGMGVEFVELPAEEKMLIEQYLRAKRAEATS